MPKIDKEIKQNKYQSDSLVWLMATLVGWVGAARSKAGLVALTLPQDSIEDCMRQLYWLGVKERCSVAPPEPGQVLADLEPELNRYFNGKQVQLDFPVDWSVFTPFQQRVLKVVKEIGYGELRSYGQVAALTGCHRAARAVGGAVGANRILLVVPCHRVIRSDGTIGGFGCDLSWKERLLTAEGVKPDLGGRYKLE